MPRSGGGTYSLPESPFVANTPISSTAVNSDLSDIADALTDSLSRTGDGGMSVQLAAIAGDETEPGYGFGGDPDTGMFRKSANILGFSAGGVEVGALSADGLELPSGDITIGGNPLVPSGVVLPYAGLTAPTGWLLCFGQAVSRTTYATLFTLFATTYGVGDGSTTFNLPDLRGRLPAGKDNMGGTAANRLSGGYVDGFTLGAVGGFDGITLDTTMIPSHTHTGTTGTESATHTHAVAPSQATGVGSAVNWYNGNNGAGAQTIQSGTESATHTHPITTNATGGGLAHSNVQPTIILNYIIKV